tara:strand:- start:928 stop:1086 length:159 start_codon:yes stop_codon:yes gene_type:complete
LLLQNSSKKSEIKRKKVTSSEKIHKFLPFFIPALASEIFKGRIYFWLQDKDF